MKLEMNRHASSAAAARGVWVCALLALSATVLPQFAHGQASATATKSLSFSAFGAYSRTNPDFGAKGNAFAFGGEVKRHLRFIDPALEMRYGHFSLGIKEGYFLGNVKFAKTLGPAGRFTPYADFGLGYGSFTYPGGNTDSAVFKNIGAGVDVDLIRHFGAKVDYQYQFWAFGGPGNVTLTPSILSIGVVYKFDPTFFRRRY